MSACHKAGFHRLGLLASEDDNVEKFLMGRQVFVVLFINLFFKIFIYWPLYLCLLYICFPPGLCCPIHQPVFQNIYIFAAISLSSIYLFPARSLLSALSSSLPNWQQSTAGNPAASSSQCLRQCRSDTLVCKVQVRHPGLQGRSQILVCSVQVGHSGM